MKKSNSKAVAFYKKILDENEEMIEKADAERNKCKELIKTDRKSEDIRRIVIRTIFSLIEGICYRLKVSALYHAKVIGVKLKKQEIAMINEESYYLASNGVAKVRNAYLKTTDNFRFAFKIFARVFGSDFELDVKGDKWEEFKKAVKIRNRITHPKNPSDMVISKEDFYKIERAHDWFVASLRKLTRKLKPQKMRIEPHKPTPIS